MQLSDVAECIVRDMITSEQIQQDIVSDSARSEFTAVKDMQGMRGDQGYQGQVQGLREDLVDKSVAGTFSVNKSSCVSLSTT